MTQNDILNAAFERHQRALEASYARQLQLQHERLAQLTTKLEATQQAEREIAERERDSTIALDDTAWEALEAIARQWAANTVAALKASLEGKSE